MSATINTGGPAFPPSNPGYAHGMTLRDYFAAKAMQGLMGRNWDHFKGDDAALMHVWAKSAYFVADAMLKAREAV